MSVREQIREYIYYNTKPFTTRQIVNELVLNYQTTKVYLSKLQSEGMVKLIGRDKEQRKVYMYNRNYVHVENIPWRLILNV